VTNKRLLFYRAQLELVPGLPERPLPHCGIKLDDSSIWPPWKPRTNAPGVEMYWAKEQVSTAWLNEDKHTCGKDHWHCPTCANTVSFSGFEKKWEYLRSSEFLARQPSVAGPVSCVSVGPNAWSPPTRGFPGFPPPGRTVPTCKALKEFTSLFNCFFFARKMCSRPSKTHHVIMVSKCQDLPRTVKMRFWSQRHLWRPHWCNYSHIAALSAHRQTSIHTEAF
jgi:hypothetical protein